MRTAEWGLRENKKIRDRGFFIGIFILSGRADLNRRPHEPEPCTLSGLSHAPNNGMNYMRFRGNCKDQREKRDSACGPISACRFSESVFASLRCALDQSDSFHFAHQLCRGRSDQAPCLHDAGSCENSVRTKI